MTIRLAPTTRQWNLLGTTTLLLLNSITTAARAPFVLPLKYRTTHTLRTKVSKSWSSPVAVVMVMIVEGGEIGW